MKRGKGEKGDKTVTIQSINHAITVDALLTLAAVPRKGVGKSSTATRLDNKIYEMIR